MTPEEFSAGVRLLGDAEALRIGLDWVATLEAGATIPRVSMPPPTCSF